MNLFIQNLFTDPYYFFSVAIVVCFSICLHEYFHAQVALWMGDSTAADAGHLTLNPLKQMGVVSLIMFAITSIAWGSVPIKKHNYKHKWSDLAVSFAGPFMNMLLFAVAWICMCLLFIFFEGSVFDSGVYANLLNFVYLFGIYNAVLFMLNMLPVPGLDGWGVYSYFFPKMNNINSELAKGIFVFLIFAVIMGARYLFGISQFFMTLSGILGEFLRMVFFGT